MARSFLQAAQDTSNATTYTFSAQNLGTADSGRYIIACISGRNSANVATTLNSASIGGVSATISVQVAAGGLGRNVVAIFIAAVPSGTTGDVVATFSGTMLSCAIQLYRIDDLNSITASDTDSSTANNPTCTLTVPNNGFAIAVAMGPSGTGPYAWTGLTEDDDRIVESATSHSSASLDFAGGGSPTITATVTGASTGDCGVFASWAFGAPAGGHPASRRLAMFQSNDRGLTVI